MSYSQHNEEEVILDYFGDFKGHLIDIGCNDGKTLSNSARLIELGWSAQLFEPDKGAYMAAKELYKDNDSVSISNVALGGKAGRVPFYSSQDSLVSSCDKSQKKIWSKFKWRDIMCDMIVYDNSWGADFINIDAEHKDWEILQTIKLKDVKCLCIEFGRNKMDIYKYCVMCGMRLIHTTDENLIFVR